MLGTDADRRVAALGNGGAVEARRIAPAMNRACVAQRAGVLASGAELDVVAGWGVYGRGIALRTGDGQDGEGSQNSERKRRKEGFTPPPANR